MAKASPTPVDPEQAFFARHDPRILPVLRRSTVGIAGAGGLGSNAAVALARAGVGKLIIADFDRIETSNLNRQQYEWSQIGQPKVHALLDLLARIQPFSEYVGYQVRVTPPRVRRLFGEADLLIEAFDRASEKQMLIEAWLEAFPDRPIIAASGLAGWGRNRSLRERRIGSLYLIGDEAGEAPPGVSPMAPRVGAAACMQANLAVELLARGRNRSRRTR